MDDAGRIPRGRRLPRLGAAGLVCVLLAGACRAEPDAGSPREAGGDAAADAVESPEATSLLDSTAWTVGALSAPPRMGSPPLPVPVLTALRTGTHAEFERLTVEMSPEHGVPGYRLEYVDRPLHECGSGRQIFPVGDAWLELRLEPAAAHTEAGQPTLGEREIGVGAPLVRRIYRTCDFEAVVVLVLAVSEPNPFRVLTLGDPPRLVVDVQR